MNRTLKNINYFLFDMDGTLYLGNRLFEGTLAVLEKIQRTGRQFLLLTNNSSLSIADYCQKMSALGIPAGSDRIFSSASATILYLQQQNPHARLFLLATPGVEAEFTAAGFELTDKSPDFVVLTFDKTLTYAKVERACRLLRQGVPFIATHPDLVCPTDQGPIPDCGAMIRMITAATNVEPKIIGKPSRDMIAFALAKLHAQPNETAIVGDRLYTDMEMGFQAGLTTVLVLSGEASLPSAQAHSPKPDFILPAIQDLLPLLH